MFGVDARFFHLVVLIMHAMKKQCLDNSGNAHCA